MSATARRPRITADDNFFWLLAALLILFFLSALFEQMESDLLAHLTGICLTLVVLVAVWSLEHNRYGTAHRLAISVFLVGVITLELIFKHRYLTLLQLVTLLAFFVTTIAIASRQVLFSGTVTLNKIVGTMCIYIFLAIAWALCFLLVEYFFPGSVPALKGEDWRDAMQKAVYFSFVTITTLGFGDISPVQPLARFLTYIEAVIGQFYVAVVVASLVGVRLADRGTPDAT